MGPASALIHLSFTIHSTGTPSHSTAYWYPNCQPWLLFNFYRIPIDSAGHLYSMITMNDSPSPMAPTGSDLPSLAVLASPPPPSSPTPQTPPPSSISPEAMDNLQTQVNRHYQNICNLLFNNYLRKMATEKGVHPDEITTQQREELKKYITKTAKPKAQQMVRTLRQKALQQQAFAFNSLSNQLPLPPLLPTLPHNHEDQTSRALFQAAASQTPLPRCHSVTPTPASISHDSQMHMSPGTASRSLVVANGQDHDHIFGAPQHSQKSHDYFDDFDKNTDLNADSVLGHFLSDRDVDQKTIFQPAINSLHDTKVLHSPTSNHADDPRFQEFGAGESLSPSIDQVGMTLDGAYFPILKNKLAGAIRSLNEALPHRNHPSLPIVLSTRQHTVVLAMSEILLFASGLVTLRNCLNKPTTARQIIHHQVRVVSQYLPLITPQARRYVRMCLKSINCFESRWSTGSRVITEVYHQFSCQKAELIKRDRMAGCGQAKLAEVLGLRREEVWRSLTPDSDDELEGKLLA